MDQSLSISFLHNDKPNSQSTDIIITPDKELKGKQIKLPNRSGTLVTTDEVVALVTENFELLRKQVLSGGYSKGELEAMLNDIFSKLAVNGGGSVINNLLYTSSGPANVTIGGIKEGEVFKNVPISTMFDRLLIKYKEPEITKFNIQRDTYQLGETMTSPITLSWTISNSINLKNGKIMFKFGTKVITPNKNITYDDNAIFNVEPIVLYQQGNKGITMMVTDDNGVKLTKTTEVKWVNTIYFGSSMDEEINVKNINSLATVNGNSVSGTFNFPAGGYKFVLIPAIWKDPTVFSDPNNGLPVYVDKMSNISITNKFGVQQEYKVFRTHNLLNGSISITIK